MLNVERQTKGTVWCPGSGGGSRECGAQAVVVGAEDVLGKHLMQLDLVIEPLCSLPEPFGHRGMNCQGAVDATRLSVFGYIYSCGPTL